MELSKEQQLKLENIDCTFDTLKNLTTIYKGLSAMSIRWERKDMTELLNEMNQLILNFVTEMRT